MAHDVRIHGSHDLAKVRSPVWVIVWTFFTIGIYGAYWWYQINRELRDLGRARGTTELGDSPGTSLLAVTLGALVLVPPFVSIYNGTLRIKAGQQLAGIPEQKEINGWLVVAFLVLIVITGIPFAVGYIQSEVNKLWENEGIAEQPVGLATTAAAPPPPAQGVTPPPPSPPPQEVTPPPPPPPASAPAAQPPPPPPVAAPTGVAAPDSPEMAQLDQLERLAALRDSGALTAEEYETQKTKILSEL